MAVSITNGNQALSIGEAVSRLQADFPDLSISKVRYLEVEGLLTLARTKGGYRQFGLEDLSRLAEILRLQKEHFLPLNVIKDRMRDWRAGDRMIQVEQAELSEPAPETAAGPDGPVSLAEALKRTGSGAETVKTLENFGLIKLIREGDSLVLSREDFEVLGIYTGLSKFGIEPRHLRMYENQAQREAVLFQQIIAPQLRHKSVKTRRQSQEDLKELIARTERLKLVLLEKALREANL